jgi:Tfp pilus assembly PilM family ATPase
MAMDYHVLAEAPGEPVRGVLSLVSKKILASRMAAAREAGLAPRVADVEALAVWTAWWALAGGRLAAPRTVWLMNIGARTTNLVIAASPDRLILVRDAQLGAAAFGTDAEGDWAMELRDSLTYARSSAGLRELDAIVLTGGGAVDGRSAALVQRLAGGVPVERWNPCADLACDEGCPPVGDAEGMRLAVALGLALRRNG